MDSTSGNLLQGPGIDQLQFPNLPFEIRLSIYEKIERPIRILVAKQIDETSHTGRSGTRVEWSTLSGPVVHPLFHVCRETRKYLLDNGCYLLPHHAGSGNGKRNDRHRVRFDLIYVDYWNDIFVPAWNNPPPPVWERQTLTSNIFDGLEARSMRHIGTWINSPHSGSSQNDIQGIFTGLDYTRMVNLIDFCLVHVGDGRVPIEPGDDMATIQWVSAPLEEYMERSRCPDDDEHTRRTEIINSIQEHLFEIRHGGRRMQSCSPGHKPGDRLTVDPTKPLTSNRDWSVRVGVGHHQWTTCGCLVRGAKPWDRCSFHCSAIVPLKLVRMT